MADRADKLDRVREVMILGLGDLNSVEEGLREDLDKLLAAIDPLGALDEQAYQRDPAGALIDAWAGELEEFTEAWQELLLERIPHAVELGADYATEVFHV